ncbi:MAG: polyamine aminopropyltransferase [Acidobacteriota bacterium]
MKKNVFYEYHTKESGLFIKPSKVLYSKKSKFQKIEIIETKNLGKILLLDGLIMTTERDEHFYHEMMVHPAMVSHPEPEEILIIGGGDGGALKEVLKYKDVKSIVIVEIDKDVIDTCKKFFSSVSFGFNDSKVEIVNEDGAKFIKRSKKFDVIFVDSSDPIGPAKTLYGEDFFGNLKNSLRNLGILILQSESPVYHLDLIKKMHSISRKRFKIAKLYLSPVPTYPGGLWSFMFCSDSIEPGRVERKLPENLKYFNLEIYNSCFILPNFMKELN